MLHRFMTRISSFIIIFFFFFNDTATTEIYTLSLHDALPIWCARTGRHSFSRGRLFAHAQGRGFLAAGIESARQGHRGNRSEEHTLNSSHSQISYAVFCLKKKKKRTHQKYKSANQTATRRAQY